jgi:hypothetical protein
MKKKARKTLDRVADALADIRTRHPSNTRQACYHYDNQFGVICVKLDWEL